MKMTNSEKRQLNSPGWLALICGILTNVVLGYAGHISLATHNAATPLVFIFLFVIFGWAAAFTAIGNGKYILAILGIVLSLPTIAIFIWFICCFYIPFYIQYFWNSTP